MSQTSSAICFNRVSETGCLKLSRADVPLAAAAVGGGGA